MRNGCEGIEFVAVISFCRRVFHLVIRWLGSHISRRVSGLERTDKERAAPAPLQHLRWIVRRRSLQPELFLMLKVSQWERIVSLSNHSLRRSHQPRVGIHAWPLPHLL